MLIDLLESSKAIGLCPMGNISKAADVFGHRISGKGFHMYKGVGVCFADFISFFLSIP